MAEGWASLKPNMVITINLKFIIGNQLSRSAATGTSPESDSVLASVATGALYAPAGGAVSDSSATGLDTTVGMPELSFGLPGDI